MMVHSRGSSFLVVALAFLLVGAACGLDVIKTTQGWEGGMLPKASNLEELVVRVGLTAPAFSVDTLYHPFLSFFYYPYTEWNMESDFLVRHNKPVVVYKYGVIDRTGQITTAGKALPPSLENLASGPIPSISLLKICLCLLPPRCGVMKRLTKRPDSCTTFSSPMSVWIKKKTSASMSSFTCVPPLK